MTGPDRARQPGPGRGIAIIVAGVLLALATNVAYTTWSVDTSQHRWCAALVTLDNADRAAPKPASKFGRQLVADFHALRLSFGCGP
jgi:hypothetical protein